MCVCVFRYIKLPSSFENSINESKSGALIRKSLGNVKGKEKPCTFILASAFQSLKLKQANDYCLWQSEKSESEYMYILAGITRPCAWKVLCLMLVPGKLILFLCS